MKKNLIVGQSGGPTAVINGSLYGVVTEAMRHTEEIDEIYGMINGIEGFLNGHMMDMRSLIETNELSLLRTTPGSYLGSCRYKLPEDLNDPVYPLLFNKFTSHGIGYFFYIGGNDSMDTVSKLSRYAKKINSDIRFIGVPKTIDNDLVHTDHTPGFGSAAKYFVCELAGDIGTDTFGHKMLTGSGKYLENLVKEQIGVKVRSIELNVCQRCSSEYLSATDLNESENAGIVGVQAALKGETGKMITFIRNCDLPYELSYKTADVNEICNMEKAVPTDWITEDGCDVTEVFIRYARPLIQGKVVLPEENGLPLFAYRK